MKTTPFKRLKELKKLIAAFEKMRAEVVAPLDAEILKFRQEQDRLVAALLPSVAGVSIGEKIIVGKSDMAVVVKLSPAANLGGRVPRKSEVVVDYRFLLPSGKCAKSLDATMASGVRKATGKAVSPIL